MAFEESLNLNEACLLEFLSKKPELPASPVSKETLDHASGMDLSSFSTKPIPITSAPKSRKTKHQA